MSAKPKEAVNHPAHYQAGGLEVIDVIEAFGLDFRLGNAAKYLLRAGRKGDVVEDLRKAQWYLGRAIEREMNTRLVAAVDAKDPRVMKRMRR